ncbi:MAG: Gfo/Idh/MocA family oxidoreductase [Pseudomonadota bacterium]
MKKLRVGVAGAGVFGNYHAQKAAASGRTELVGVFDLDEARATQIAGTYGARGFGSFDALLDAVDAVVVAVPATYHETLAAQALSASKHVLVEKPLALNAQSARTLAAQAVADDLILQVGHQERFVAKAMGVFAIDEKPLIMESVRAGPPPGGGRAGDVSVIWDLMIHDLDLAACMIANKFESVSATGQSVTTNHIDEAEAEFTYVGGATAKLRASRAAEERERTMRLVYESGEISVDFLTRRLTNTTPYQVRVDIAADLPDPLGAADESFFAACLGELDSPVPGHGAIGAVAMAEAAEASVLAG